MSTPPVLQMRPQGAAIDAPYYAPGRDIGNVYPQILRAVFEQLSVRQAPLGLEYLPETAGCEVADLQAVIEAVYKMQQIMLDSGEATTETAIADSGWNATPPAARAWFLSQLGWATMLGMLLVFRERAYYDSQTNRVMVSDGGAWESIGEFVAKMLDISRQELQERVHASIGGTSEVGSGLCECTEEPGPQLGDQHCHDRSEDRASGTAGD